MSSKDGVSATKTFPAPSGYRGQLIATVRAYTCGSNAHPHFSVTGEISTEPERKRGDVQCCGCIHEDILAVWPAFKPLIDLHLSNADDGEPMHALENAWYWLQGALPESWQGKYHGGNGSPSRSPEKCLDILARHLRIPDDQAERLRDDALSSGEPKAFLTSFVKAQKPRWIEEAKHGVRLIISLQ